MIKLIVNKIKKYGCVVLTLMVLITSFSTMVYASSTKFGADMQQRVVDGKENGKTYSIGAGKTITVSGEMGAYSYSDEDHESTSNGYLCAPQPTYVTLCESNIFGMRTEICRVSKTISAIGSVAKFSCSGTSEHSSKKYLFIYKPLNDGLNMSISGTIVY